MLETEQIETTWSSKVGLEEDSNRGRVMLAMLQWNCPVASTRHFRSFGDKRYTTAASMLVMHGPQSALLPDVLTTYPSFRR